MGREASASQKPGRLKSPLPQSGMPDLKFARLSDVKLLEEARRTAEELFARDPDLRLAEHQPLAKKVDEFWKGKGDLS